MRKERRTREEWKAIFLDQQSSGITAREYCAKHGINIKTFSARKSDFNKRKAQLTGKLVKVVRPKPELPSAFPQLSVVYHGVTLNVGKDIEAQWLVEVMKALAS